MSIKRTATDFCMTERRTDNSDATLQQIDDSKRSRLASISDTKLQDLPTELLHNVLVKAVAMEMQTLELARFAWKTKIRQIVKRFSNVCLRWKGILKSKLFQPDVVEYLEKREKKIRMEILCSSWTTSHVYSVTAINDEIFTLNRTTGQDYSILCYDRNNMAVVKNTILLPADTHPEIMVGCGVSHCLYVLDQRKCCHIGVARIKRDDEDQFEILPFIGDMWQPHPTLTVSTTGAVIISRQTWRLRDRAVVSYFNAEGLLQYRVRLSLDVCKFTQLVEKPNGNLVLVTFMEDGRKFLTEINTLDGSILREYGHTGWFYSSISNADLSGRMVMTDKLNRVKLLDCELNQHEFTCAQLNGVPYLTLCGLHFNCQRNEVLGVYGALIVVFRFVVE